MPDLETPCVLEKITNQRKYVQKLASCGRNSTLDIANKRRLYISSNPFGLKGCHTIVGFCQQMKY